MNERVKRLVKITPSVDDLLPSAQVDETQKQIAAVRAAVMERAQVLHGDKLNDIAMRRYLISSVFWEAKQKSMEIANFHVFSISLCVVMAYGCGVLACFLACHETLRNASIAGIFVALAAMAVCVLKRQRALFMHEVL
jgi:hypothetical protein